MSCCKTDLGEFPHNEDINTGIIVPPNTTGTWTIEFTNINGTKLKIETQQTAGQPFVIPKGILNENFYYCFTAWGIDSGNESNPTIYLTPSPFDPCTNFCFKTYVQVTPDCGDPCQ